MIIDFLLSEDEEDEIILRKPSIESSLFQGTDLIVMFAVSWHSEYPRLVPGHRRSLR